MDHIVVSKIQDGDYTTDYVTLPKNYSTDDYFSRDDIKTIHTLVYAHLDELNKHTNFVEEIKQINKILIKPNLVSVYHDCGMNDMDYPESTDPRVFDAIIAYLKQYNDNIIIVESSGKPMPTMTSFRAAGYDRIAKYRNVGLVALELRPVSRYMLPKAEIMKEVYIPDIFEDVLSGEAYYISVPKLKTNLYTQVTLGFKNAMGSLPYSMRERNHNYMINKKLADLLYLFKPHLTIIDGIIGGEGYAPSPVDAVNSHVLISGHNAVAVDEVGSKVMGFNPQSISLLREAIKRGFGTDSVDIHLTGTKELPIYNFRRASSSFYEDDFKEFFPSVQMLAGYELPTSPKISEQATSEDAHKMHLSCEGGCLSALKSGFEYVRYSTKGPNYSPLLIVAGPGVLIAGERCWFDENGKKYTEGDISKVETPIMTLGSCTSSMEKYAKYKISGCCSPSSCMLAATKSMGVPFPLLTPKNSYFLNLGTNVLKVVFKRISLTLKGKWVDCPSEHKDMIYEIPLKHHEHADYILYPLPKMKASDKIKLIGDQLKILKM